MDYHRTIGHKLRVINKEIRNNMEEKKAANGDDLTPMQRWTIGFLYDHQSEEIYQRDIEDVFSISRATASNILTLMEKKELIIRVSVKHDARLKKIMLTEKSSKIMKQVERDVNEMESRLLSGMTEEEAEQFQGYLDRIIQNLGGERECEPTRCSGSKECKAHVKK